MRYLLILDESQYNDFEKVDGNLLEIYAIDQNGNKRLLDLRPIQREMVVMPNGASAYITQGHIDAMMEYEREQHIKEICDRMNHNLDGINDVDLPKHVLLLTPEEVKRQFGIVSPSEYAQKQYAVDPEELKKAINGEEINNGGRMQM